MWVSMIQMICLRIDRLQQFLEILLRKKDEENNSKGYPARIHLIAEVDLDEVQAWFIRSYEFYIFYGEKSDKCGIRGLGRLFGHCFKCEIYVMSSLHSESELFYLVILHIRLPFPTVHVFLYL